MTPNSYHDVRYTQVRACDVFRISDTRLYYFVLDEHGRATGDHFRTLDELRRYIDALPKHQDKEAIAKAEELNA